MKRRRIWICSAAPGLWPPAGSRVRHLPLIAAVFVVVSAWSRPAHAMHLSEGILPAAWAGGWFAVAVPFVAWGLWCVRRRQEHDPRSTALVSLVGAGVFVISCMPVPIPWLGTCSHPCGTGLAAVLIGAGPTIVVASIALLFQALFLAHGGLTTLGANIVSMGVVGAFSAVGSFSLLRRLRVPLVAAAFAAGVISDWATYATTSFQLAASLPGGALMSNMLLLTACFVPTQVPLGIGEGFMTAIAYRFVALRRPELLSSSPLLEMAAGDGKP